MCKGWEPAIGPHAISHHDHGLDLAPCICGSINRNKKHTMYRLRDIFAERWTLIGFDVLRQLGISYQGQFTPPAKRRNERYTAKYASRYAEEEGDGDEE